MSAATSTSSARCRPAPRRSSCTRRPSSGRRGRAAASAPSRRRTPPRIRHAMIAIRRFAQRLFWPSVVATAAAIVVSVILFVVGAAVIGGIVLGVVGVVAIPLLAFGYASPRAGLAWDGSYAEGWRSERSPGEWSSIEAERFDRDARRR